jgi:hypothetical protein
MATTTEMANAIEPPATECRPLMIECWPPRTGLRQRPSARQARFDMLTGARQRGPELADMQRKNRAETEPDLVVVFASSLTNPIREPPDQQGLRRPLHTPGTCETDHLGPQVSVAKVAV